jgi:OOP family OmpA-OmpF porin
MMHLNTKIFILAGLVLAGSAGMTRAEADCRDVVRDMEGQTIHSSNGNCVRTQWTADQDACAPQLVVEQKTVTRRQETRTTAMPTQEERTVYFEFNHATLTPEAKERLDSLVNVLKSNDSVKEAGIVGYADRIGSVSYNERLSQKRAEAVRDYLVANGYTNARVTATRWVGKSEPSTNCSARETHAQLVACLHNDRKVEVEIEYLSEEQTPDAR